jgi:hypothetical protein
MRGQAVAASRDVLNDSPALLTTGSRPDLTDVDTHTSSDMSPTVPPSIDAVTKYRCRPASQTNRTHQSQALPRVSSLILTYTAASMELKVSRHDVGATCLARSYSYNTHSDRLGEAATAPVAAGATSATNPTGCATPAPPATTHTFDSAGRLTDTGYTYDTFGRPGGRSTSTRRASTGTSSSYFRVEDERSVIPSETHPNG